jgi:antitoxin component YwqK of YwqJK toxin-antitoxin module
MKRYTIGLITLLLIVGCGKKDGVHTTYDGNNTKYEDITYKDGKMNGLYTEWRYPKVGIKSREGNYKDDKKDGLWTNWYEDGTKHYKQNFKDGKEDGLKTTWSGFNSSEYYGQKREETNYKDGERDGLYTKWWYGYKSEEGTYKDGKKIGVWNKFNAIGGITSKVEWFENGRSISYKSPSSSSSSLTLCDCNNNYGSLSTSQKRECDKMTDGLSTSEIQTLLLLEQCD